LIVNISKWRFTTRILYSLIADEKGSEKQENILKNRSDGALGDLGNGPHLFVYFCACFLFYFFKIWWGRGVMAPLTSHHLRP
jgi:hypothetical protein